MLMDLHLVNGFVAFTAYQAQIILRGRKIHEPGEAEGDYDQENMSTAHRPDKWLTASSKE